MATAQKLEEQLVHSLQQNKDDETALITFRQRARLAERSDRYVEMGVIYGAMATYLTRDLDLPLRAAQAYQKAGLTDDMTRYYLLTIERYVGKSDPSKAGAVLKQFLALGHDDVQIPPSILELCDKHGINRPSHPPSIPALNESEKASGLLRQQPLFSAMEEKVFTRVVALMRWHEHPMGHEFISQSTKSTGVYFILCGQVDVFVLDHGQRNSLGHLGARGVCGQVAALTAGSHVINAITMTDVELMELPVTALEHVHAIAPQFLAQMYRECWQQNRVSLLTPLPALHNLEQKIRQRVHKRMPKLKVATAGWLQKIG
ncbi:MAG: cyclic nucleotide-binding domain-containing protein [Mariprofundaceae bacterium]|nr:cyclic nucleotide-binding domain-containing protein [Mariprofundaceae bacterium]